MSRAPSRWWMMLCLILWMACTGNWVLAGKVFYIIEDEQGRTRMYDTLPPGYAQKGYRVVNQRGVTLEVVPPKGPSKPKKPGLSESDKVLLETFYSVEDIIQARDRQIATIEGIIHTTESNTEAYQRNLEKLKTRARDHQAAGEPVPDKLDGDIQRMQQQVRDNQAFVREKRREQRRIREKYNRDIERYISLKEGTKGR